MYKKHIFELKQFFIRNNLKKRKLNKIYFINNNNFFKNLFKKKQ